MLFQLDGINQEMGGSNLTLMVHHLEIRVRQGAEGLLEIVKEHGSRAMQDQLATPQASLLSSGL